MCVKLKRRTQHLILALQSLDQIIQGLVSIVLDQVHHSLYLLAVFQDTDQFTYIRHDGLAIGILHVAEGHLGALMLVDEQFGVVQVGNFFQGNCDSQHGIDQIDQDWKLTIDSPFSWTTMRVTRTAVSVVICLGPNLRPT